jgi:GH25 family lysozyme M1 (1,4-beta-N-acetylmuramidase)
MSTDPLVIDTYADEGPHHWRALPPHVHGAILKVSQGTLYHRDAWLTAALAQLATAHRGGFHYLDLMGDGGAQALYHLQHARACGLYTRPTDFAPAADVEWATGDRNSGATRQQIEDCVNAFADVIRAQLGVGPILYFNGMMFALKGLRGLLGCDWGWIARYTEGLPAHTRAGDGYQDVGVSLAKILLWQYAGDGIGHLKGYPHRLDAFGKSDMNVAIAPSGPASAAHLARATLGASHSPAA